MFKILARSAVGKYMLYISQISSLVIIARIVSPTEFGVFSLLNSVFFFFGIIAEFGLIPLIVNYQEKNKDGYLFLIAVMASIFSACVFYLLSGAVLSFFDLQVTSIALMLISLSIAYYGLSSYYLGVFNRSGKFVRLGVIELSAEVVALLSFVLMAEFSQQSMVNLLCLKLFVFYFLRFIFLALHVRFIPSFFSSDVFLYFRENIKHDLKFIAGVLGSNVLSFFSRYSDNLFIGKMFGSTELGYYDRAYQIVKYPVMLLSMSIQPAIQPAVRGLKCEKEFVRNLDKIYVILLAIGICASLFVYFFSYHIVILLLGEDWILVAKYMDILALSIPFQLIFSISGSFFYALGRSIDNLVLNLFQFSLVIASLVLGYIYTDIYLLLYLISFSFLVSSILGYILVVRCAKTKFCGGVTQ